MRWDQYSNVLQLAAALSLAGWVARTPDSQIDPSYYNSQYNAYQDTRYHPYSNVNGQFNQGNPQFNGPSPMLEQNTYPQNYPQGAYGGPHQNIFDSKEVDDGMRAFNELQELISWQEAYRRGDLNVGGNQQQQQVLPITNEQNTLTANYIDQTSTLPNDDGYSSASSGSPSPTVVSDFSTIGLFDDPSNSLSPFSDVFEPPRINEFLFEDTDGATGYTPFPQDNLEEFDLDQVLRTGELNELELAKLDAAKRPFDNLNLKGNGDDFEDVDSPLKSPNFDEFLGSPMPGHEPAGAFHDQSFEDPFNMKFTNSSGGNKFTPESYLELNDLNPSGFDLPISDDDLDEALVSSLSQKYAKAAASKLIPTDPIKKEVNYPGHHVGDHDYPRQFRLPETIQKLQQKLPLSPSNLMRLNQRRSPQLPIRTERRRRTFAPTSTTTTTMKAKAPVKQQKKKSGFVWPDFEYTSDELVTMRVDIFNEVIEKLDAVRQHVARDIRRKGKNKLAARSCRKRKMDVIDELDNGVGGLENQRRILLEERQKLLDETRQIRSKTEWLNNYIFEHLRDSNGKPYSPTDFSLQYTSDGDVYLVPSGKKNSPKAVEV